LELAVRILTVPLILIGALAATLAASAPSLARDITLPKTTADALKSVCGKVGGKFEQGANLYTCGTDCHGGGGTDCIVSCAPDQKCTAQVIGGRRPRSVEEALQVPAKKGR
jgi:hypothetical protein